MQIKFKTAYSINTPLIVPQKDLLEQWIKSCDEYQIKFIEKANLDFKDYDILEYPNQEQLKKEYTTYLATFSSDLSEENVDKCFKEFAKSYRILELTIIPENYE